MAYSELIKDISRIRDYLREFFVFGFRSREEIGRKSPRSYDNEKRRIESWLSGYMSFRQDATGKNVFMSVDTRHVQSNPLYNAWKASSFTDNDITLHFWLMDILEPDTPKSIPEIMDVMVREYLPLFGGETTIDESTLRKKLKEYAALGLITTHKQGKRITYRLSGDNIDLRSWLNAISYFTEENPLGLIGSFLQDKYKTLPELFLFKHNYILFAPDSGIMLELLIAINEKKNVALEIYNNRKRIRVKRTVLPLKIYISTQGGRQYLAAYDVSANRILFFRLDTIQAVKTLDAEPEYSSYEVTLKNLQKHLWGVASKQTDHTYHLEMILNVEHDEHFIITRLEREKRCGTVKRLDDTLWAYSADVYDPQEMIPWIRTFIGRIVSLGCTDEEFAERFKADISEMAEFYGGIGDAV